MSNNKQGGDILKELCDLRDWHTKTAASRVNLDKRRKREMHTGYAYLIDAARAMIMRQDEILAQNAEPFTDPNRKNTHAR